MDIYHEHVEFKDLVAKLTTKDPKIIVRKAAESNRLSIADAYTCVAREVFAIYNAGRRSKRLDGMLLLQAK